MSVEDPGTETTSQASVRVLLERDGIRLETRARVATLFLNRPEVYNALDRPMRQAILTALQQAADDASVKALVLSGVGKAFCAGGDINGMQQRLTESAGHIGPAGWNQQSLTCQLAETLYNLPKPTIAAVNGAAAGIGCDLALCCDFIVAGSRASFSMSFILRGLVPDASAYLLPQRIGLARARDLLYSGRRVACDEALRIGLVDRQAGADDVLEQAHAWALELADKPATAMALTKMLLIQGQTSSAHSAFAQSRLAQALCFTSEDHQLSVQAFLASSSTRS